MRHLQLRLHVNHTHLCFAHFDMVDAHCLSKSYLADLFAPSLCLLSNGIGFQKMQHD